MAISKLIFKVLPQNDKLSLQQDTSHNDFVIITDFDQEDMETQNNPPRVIKTERNSKYYSIVSKIQNVLLYNKRRRLRKIRLHLT